MTGISLAQANNLIAGVLQEGEARDLAPLTVAVADAGGHLIALQRSDGSSNFRPEIALGKACGSLGLGVSSRRIGEMAMERPTFVAMLGGVAPQGVMPAAGGVIIVDERGNAIGAVGVTGDSSDNDEACALAGLAAAGLRAQG